MNIVAYSYSSISSSTNNIDFENSYIYYKYKVEPCYLFSYRENWILDCKNQSKFWSLFKEKYQLPKEDLTLKFIITMENQLLLLSIHSNKDLKEIKELKGFETIKPIRKVTSIEDAKNEFKYYNENIKGYVIIDQKARLNLEFPIFKELENIDLERIDSKYSNDSSKNLLEIIRVHSHYSHDIDLYLKETHLYEQYLTLKSEYFSLCKSIDEDFDKFKHINNKKEFCLAVKNSKYSSFLIHLFLVEEKKTSFLF